MTDGTDTLYPMTAPDIGLKSLGTTDSTTGFKLTFATTTSFIILYYDMGGRIALLRKSAYQVPVIFLCSGAAFEAQAVNATEIYLRVGTYIRAGFIIASQNQSSISITTYVS